MKIEITGVNGDANIERYVNFMTQWGEGYGLWINEEASQNKEYFVELEIQESLLWGKDIYAVSSSRFSIKYENKKVFLTGFLERLSDVWVFRIGGDLIMVDVLGKIDLQDGFVCINTEGLKIYNINL